MGQAGGGDYLEDYLKKQFKVMKRLVIDSPYLCLFGHYNINLTSQQASKNF